MAALESCCAVQPFKEKGNSIAVMDERRRELLNAARDLGPQLFIAKARACHLRNILPLH